MTRRTAEPALFPILAVFFLSGASALTYEILWTRHLGLVFGITSYAVGTVLAAFMGGLALGSFLAARRADRDAHPLRTYARLELAIAILGLLVPSMLAVVRHVSAELGYGGEARPTELALSAFLLSAIVLIAPTTLMGATLPFLARYAARRRESLGGRVGLLYAINTLGGMAGAFAAAFIVIEAVGMRGANFAAVALNLTVAASAFALARRDDARVAPVTERSPGTAGGAVPRDAGELSPDRRRLVMAAYFISGATALAYEILLTRILIFFLWDTTVYSFATVLTVFLAGLAAGSAIVSRFVDRGRALVAVFGMLHAALGLTVLALLPALDHLTPVRSSLWEGFYRSGELGIWRYLGLKFAMAAIVMIVPTLLMGATFPVVNRLISPDSRRLGRSVGLIYGVNTLGAILGSVVAGFWLVPALGIGRGLLAIAAMNMATGILLISREPAWTTARRVAWSAAAAGFFIVLTATSGPGRPVIEYSDLMANPAFHRELVFTREGREATLSILRDPASEILELNINGQSTAFTSYMDLQVHRMLGHLPALCHTSPESALVIGFGFGSTCHALVSEGVSRVDCVELIPDERESATWFAEVNRHVTADPAFHFIAGDGRQYVLATPHRYDVISFNAIHPKLSASLYTLDFYRLCASKLAPGGVIAAWLPVNFLSRDEFHMLTRTFQQAFPHTTLWYLGPGHVILVGTPERYVLDLARIERGLARPAAREDLAASNLDDVFEIASMYLLDEDAVRQFAGDGPLNTDDRPRVEFGISFSSGDWYRILQEIYALTPKEAPGEVRLAAAGTDAAGGAGSGGEAEVRERLARTFQARSYSLFGSIVHAVGVSTRDINMVELGIAKYRRAVEIVPESRNTRHLLEDKEIIYRTLTTAGAAPAAGR